MVWQTGGKQQLGGLIKFMWIFFFFFCSHDYTWNQLVFDELLKRQIWSSTSLLGDVFVHSFGIFFSNLEPLGTIFILDCMIFFPVAASTTPLLAMPGQLRHDVWLHTSSLKRESPGYLRESMVKKTDELQTLGRKTNIHFTVVILYV